jgi:hypothetical protein
MKKYITFVFIVQLIVFFSVSILAASGADIAFEKTTTDFGTVQVIRTSPLRK